MIAHPVDSVASVPSDTNEQTVQQPETTGGTGTLSDTQMHGRVRWCNGSNGSPVVQVHDFTPSETESERSPVDELQANACCCVVQ